MTDEPTAAEVECERSLARIFRCYADYVKSLPARKWERTEKGRASAPR